jgi:GT2 family glycosyltransferase
MTTKEYELDVILTTHNRLDMTMKCIGALYAYTASPFHLIIVDDSTDLTPLYVTELKRKYSNITYIYSDEPYIEGNQIFNIGLEHCKTDYVGIVMNSVIVEPEWDATALRLMNDEPDVGVIGFKCLFPDGKIESAGIMMQDWLPCDIGRDFASHRLSSIYECVAVQWAFALVRVAAAKGNLEEGIFYGFKGVDDIDNSFVIRDKGWRIFYCGLGVGYHTPRATRGDDTLEGKKMNAYNMTTFYKRWGMYERFLEATKGVTEEDMVHIHPKPYVQGQRVHLQGDEHLAVGK